MLGEQLADAAESPGQGQYWTSSAAHPSLPRSEVIGFTPAERDLATVLFGPSSSPYGRVNLFGALRRALAKSGYSDLKEFQRVGLTVRG
jgi:IMP dehydrogenase